MPNSFYLSKVSSLYSNDISTFEEAISTEIP